MTKKISLAIIASALLLSSCASIIENNHQKININPIGSASANCKLKNGREAVNAVSSAKIRRSKTDLDINCSDSQTGAVGSKTVTSDLEPWTFGNILLGGIIGLGVDLGTGSAWKYPTEIDVNMKQPQNPASEEQLIPNIVK